MRLRKKGSASWADFEAHFNEEWYVGIAAAIFQPPSPKNLTTSTDSFRGFARSHCRIWRAKTSTTSFPVRQEIKKKTGNKKKEKWKFVSNYVAALSTIRLTFLHGLANKYMREIFQLFKFVRKFQASIWLEIDGCRESQDPTPGF